MNSTLLTRPSLAVGLALLIIGTPVSAQTDGGEWQLTTSPISKLLDNNDNFSRDNRFLVFDTRDTLGGGKPGAQFGKMQWLTQRGTGVPAAEALVWSRDGKRLAFNRRVPTLDAEGKLVKDAGGNDFRQIFLVDFPDANGDGVADGVR